MASKTINTILTLQDKMSPKLLKVSDKVKDLDKNTQRATKRMVNMSNKFASSVNTMVAKSAKFAAIGATMLGGLAIKGGLSEAFDLEGYRMQLETATKDTQKASKIMKYAIDLANKTPFEGGTLVEGAAKLEAMGMSAQEWLPKIGDMAAATNKDFDQAVEAIIDAQTGELERLKEFGITKRKIAEKANQMFVGQEVVNAKGQIVNQEKFNEAMVKIMEERFTGGMEKQATTVKGIWSTITGVTKSALSTMVGMQADGTIKSGSMLEKLKQKALSFSKMMEKWQSDGTIDKLADKFTRAFTMIYNVTSKTFKFILKYQDVIVFLGSFALSIAGITKVMALLKTTMAAFSVVMAIANGTMVLCPTTWIIAGIAAIVAGGVLLIKNWDEVKAAATKLWEKVKEIFGKIKDLFKNPFKATVEFVTNNAVTSKKDKEKTTAKKRTGRNALGTSYWKGGYTSINERGGEIIDLPSGSRVIPADKSEKLVNNNKTNNIVININATNKSTSEVMNELVPKLKLALANI